MPPRRRIPAWFAALTVLCLLPAGSLPWLLAAAPAGARTLLWGYGISALLAAWLALACRPGRPAVSWVLLAVLLLTHLCAWITVLGPK